MSNLTSSAVHTTLTATTTLLQNATTTASSTLPTASTIIKNFTTPTFIRVVDPWVPTIDTLATIIGDGLGLIVKGVQLGVAIRQLHSLFRLENVAQQQQVVHVHHHYH